MIGAVTALLICQLAGEVIVRALSLPFPGPVAGLGMMFLLLLWRGRSTQGEVPSDIAGVADNLLKHLSLLFIPAAVGVVQYLDLLRRYAGQIAVTILVSTTIALAATALTFRLVSRLHAFRHKPLDEEIVAVLDAEHHP